VKEEKKRRKAGKGSAKEEKKRSKRGMEAAGRERERESVMNEHERDDRRN